MYGRIDLQTHFITIFTVNYWNKTLNKNTNSITTLNGRLCGRYGDVGL